MVSHDAYELLASATASSAAAQLGQPWHTKDIPASDTDQKPVSGIPGSLGIEPSVYERVLPIQELPL